MRLLVLFLPATIVALLIQTTAGRVVPNPALVPDLVVILIVDVGLRHREAMGALAAFAMGYATDLVSGSQIGLNAFLAVLIFFLVYQVSRRLLVSGVALGMFAVFVAVVIKDFAGFAIASHFAALGRAGDISRTAVIQAAITTLVAPIVFNCLARGRQILGMPKRGAPE